MSTAIAAGRATNTDYYSNTADTYDHLVKILIVGDSGVGKSCLLLRFADDSFSDLFLATIGVEFKFYSTNVGDKKVKMQMWDTAGQERFRTITCSYYRGAHGVLLAFDLTDRESFRHVQSWLDEIRRYSGDNVCILLVGTKLDLTQKRQVSREEAQQFADSHNMQYIETSAKTDTHVADAFLSLAATIVNRAEERRAALTRKNDPKQINLSKKIQKKGDNACCVIV